MINNNWKDYEKVYTLVPESLCYTAEINSIVNQLYFSKINFKKRGGPYLLYFIYFGYDLIFAYEYIFIDGKVGHSSSKKRKVATTSFPRPQELG